MDQPTKGGHRNRGSLTTASLTLVPLDLKNSASPVNMKFGQFQSDPLEGVGAQGGASSGRQGGASSS